ncbi:hypothetical protein B0H14DRAFT_3070638 [Mycena olivaceomarginata]|nr:hypothetical protein B0H14DRAFT_3070638 [Mycena olivaceomarginata]
MSLFGHVPASYLMSSPMPQVLGGGTRVVPAATSLHFHVASHVSHPHVAPCSVPPCASSAPSGTCYPSALPPTLLTSHSNLDASPLPSTRRKNRSRRCFVCGGTGKHRLHPRFCPAHPRAHLQQARYVQLRLSSRLLRRFTTPHDATSRRSCGALAVSSGALFTPCSRFASRTSCSHFESRPSNLEIESPARHRSCRQSSSHHRAQLHPRPIPHSDHSGVSSIPHFPPVERLRSPPIYLPVRLPFPDSKPPTDAASENSSPHIALNIFELLFVSPPIRNELRKLIDTMDRLNVGYEIPSCPSLRKVFYRILDQIMESLSSVR